MLLVMAAALFGGGCASDHNSVTMQSLTLRRDYTQNFTQAYSALSDSGDYVIVLVHDVGSEKVASSGEVLQPTTVSPRQIMILRVYWIPEHGTKLDHPVASNASVGWYVFGDRLDESAELLKYSGGGLVLVSESDGLASVTIRGASLKLTTHRGGMADPLGPCSLNGDVVAVVDRDRVNELLTEAKQADSPGGAPPPDAISN
jgi:hypothetical protein